MSSYYICHRGDYEIYHVNQANMRREHRGMPVACMWKIYMPNASVRFVKEVESDKEFYVKAHVTGLGCVEVNGKEYPCDKEIVLPAGKYYLQVNCTNPGSLCSAYVESDLCPSDGTWKTNNFAGPWLSAACLYKYDSVERTPIELPYVYTRCDVVSTEAVDGGALYDFGTEIFGYSYIENADANCSYELYYGESREEALDTAYTYLTDTVSGSSSYKLRQRAFRYIYVKGNTAGLKLYAELEVLPLEKKGYFECDNEVFNEIYGVSAYTFLLNCREGFFDGLKRDRWIWGGDAYQSARINAYLHYDKEIEQRTTIGLLGNGRADTHVNTIMDYSLLQIIGILEHHINYGDTEYLEYIYPVAKELLEFCETRLNADGFIEGFGPDWTFIDWSDIDKTGAVCAEQILLVATYKAMSSLALCLERNDESEAYGKKAVSLMKRVNKYYWSEEKGAYIDSYVSGKNNVTRHANIFAIMYGLACRRRTKSILNNVLKNDSITKITTPYFKGYELDVLAKLGELDTIEEVLSSYYGGMIKLGAKTIWEEYDPTLSGIEHYAMYGGKYEKSLCHAWGAGPIYIFGKYYLGVSPIGYGYEGFEVKPRLGGLKKINGCVPIKDGEVKVYLDEHTLKVCATRNGGTLVFKGKKTVLNAGCEVVINY